MDVGSSLSLIMQTNEQLHTVCIIMEWPFSECNLSLFLIGDISQRKFEENDPRNINQFDVDFDVDVRQILNAISQSLKLIKKC